MGQATSQYLRLRSARGLTMQQYSALVGGVRRQLVVEIDMWIIGICMHSWTDYNHEFL
jgi:hypothetical protein